VGYSTPDTTTPPRPSLRELSADAPDPNIRGRILYLRSYLLMRAVIGLMGVGLPIVLLLGDGLLLEGDALPRGSLSAYYHSGMRDVFVGTLSVIAIFLITYKVFEHHLDNVLSIVAGVAALGVALFPTGRPSTSNTLPTPLQEQLGETAVATVHYVSAVVFILLLAAMSYIFGIREGNRTQNRRDRMARRSPLFWRRYHWGCTIVIGLALLFVIVTKATDWLDDYSLLIGEIVAVFAFGASWLAKGLELDVLLRPETARKLGAVPG
jgi:hypothetical protein